MTKMIPKIDPPPDDEAIFLCANRKKTRPWPSLGTPGDRFFFTYARKGWGKVMKH
jgi:hypothetical protein